VIVGFLFAIPLSAWSSRTSWGERAKAHGLFLTPEEIDPPDVLRRFQQALTDQEDCSYARSGNGLTRVLQDAEAWDLHLSLLPPASQPNDPKRQNHLERLILKVRQEGPDSLAAREKRDLLLDEESLRQLRSQLVCS